MSLRDILIITVDSLRADRVGFIGSEGGMTPALNDFAAESLVYTDAMAHGPTTFTSFPSILTGRHGYRNPEFPKLSGPSIADRALAAGYHTLSVTSNPWLSQTYDYDSGFVESYNLGQGPRSADSTWDRIRHRIGDTLGEGRVFNLVKDVYDRLRNISPDDRSEEDVIHDIVTEHVARDEPTFTWVHYMTTHTPYTVDPETSAPSSNRTINEAEQRELIDEARESPGEVAESDREVLVDLYDSSVRHFDRRLRDLLDVIDFSDTLICLAADHGEAFWEHGYFEHPPALHQELLHVPLVVKTPDRDPDRIGTPVGLDAVPGTISEASGLDFDGPALPPWGGAPVEGSICAAIAHESRWEPQDASWDSLMVAVREGDWKLITDSSNKELFDLGTDPGESTNVAADNPVEVKRLMTRAESYQRDFVFNGGEIAPVELEDRLSDLGYLQ